MTYKYPNVVFDFAANVADDVDKAIHAKMADLIDTLAVKYSGWQFIAVDGKYTSEHRTRIEAHRFKVLDDSNPRQEIGDISLTHRYNRNKGMEICYAIYNRRIAGSRDRGNRVVTMDKKLALKTVGNFFTPAPMSERLLAACIEARNTIDRQHKKRTSAMALSLEDVVPSMLQFMQANWEQFIATVPTEVVKEAEHVNSLQEEISKLELLLPQHQKSGKLLTVIIEHDKYAVLHDGNVSAYNIEEVPTEMRQAIGMLKLNEVGAVVPEVGMRVGNNSFFILVPKEA